MLLASYVILWVLVLGLGLSVVFLLREHADLVLSFKEGRSRYQGPAEGAKVPPLRNLVLQSPRDSSRSTDRRPEIVLFMSVHCSPCWEQRKGVALFASDHEKQLLTTVCCSGDADNVQLFASELGDAVRVLVDEDAKTSAEWRIFSTPFAVGVDAKGRVKAKVANPGYDSLVMLAAGVQERSSEPRGRDSQTRDARLVEASTTTVTQ